MLSRRPVAIVVAIATVAAAPAIRATAQTIDFLTASPTTDSIVRDAPFSAEGLTTVTQTLSDGTRIERKVRTKLYRDGTGRVRREQTVLGLSSLSPESDGLAVVVIVDPVKGFTYTLSPSTRTARRAPLATRPRVPPPPPPAPPPTIVTDPAAPPPPLPAPPRAVDTSLGTREIDGLSAIGTRRTHRIPVGAIGNDRPIEILDERWVSRDLHVLLASRHEDPRTGVVTFRLMNVKRAEPPANLFILPPAYTVTDVPRGQL